MAITLKIAEPKNVRPKREKPKNPFSTQELPKGLDPQRPDAPGRNRRVVVVDDDPVVLRAFENRLKADGFAVSAIRNASLVASTVEGERADVIILDINLPLMGSTVEWNGFTVMRWLRRFPELSKVPVILISGASAAEYRERSLAEGAVAFFEKPVVYVELLAAMAKAFEEQGR